MARTFGTTWWGQAWLDALEGIAGENSGRLSRGRTYARQGRAEDLVINPGSVQAWVQGTRDDPYEVYLDIREFREDEWDTVLDAFADKAGHAAALLDGELDPGLVADAEAVDVHLLPRPRDLRTACSCPDDVDPCKHAAAVTYLIAAAIDHDPFVLLLLRGRRRDEILEDIRRRRSGDPEPDETDAAVIVATTSADEAWTRTLTELPLVPVVADSPGRPAAWPSDPPAHAPFTAAGLRSLVADAARRAWELAAGSADGELGLDAHTDLARRAAAASPAEREVMASHSGIAPVELDVLATAWTHGGAAAVRASDESRWTPTPLEMAAARDLICDAGFSEKRVHISGNRITAEGRLQFRRSRDGHWYLFSKASGRWALLAPPAEDLEDLVLRDFSA